MSRFDDHDRAFMTRALELAELGLYTTTPNPRVGCVLVRDGHIIGEGWHQRAGGPHAEVHALADAAARGADARGATVYVTLEPCNHQGRTPPCTDALLAAGVSRVVAAMADPYPPAAHGADRLRAAGVDVAVGVKEKDARALIAPWSKCVTTGLPYLSLKLAVSLDGRIATRTGASKWVTGPDARDDAERRFPPGRGSAAAYRRTRRQGRAL